jgi:predicted GIY-YIG superfamily endonuclease
MSDKETRTAPSGTGDCPTQYKGKQVCYLLHFLRPYVSRTGKRKQTVRHYLGCTLDLERRLKEHRDANGRGSRIAQIVREAGIHFILVRVWEGGFELEQKLKARHERAMLCPLCKERALAKHRTRRWMKSITKN